MSEWIHKYLSPQEIDDYKAIAAVIATHVAIFGLAGICIHYL